MTLLEDAFAKAGLPVSAVAFASACRDLAHLALNREPNPARAVSIWAEMTRYDSHGFRAALIAFIEAVAAERTATKSVEGRNHRENGIQDAYVRPLTELHTGDEEDHVSVDIHDSDVSSSPVPHPFDSGSHSGVDTQPGNASASGGPEHGRGDHKGHDTQFILVAPPVPREPSKAQIKAVAEARAGSARILSGIFITERQGSRTPIETVTVSSLERRLAWLGSRVSKSAIEYNFLWLVNKTVGPKEHISDTTLLADVLTRGELLALKSTAEAFGDSPMFQVPERLRRKKVA